MIFTQYLTKAQKSRTSIDISMPIVRLEFHLNYWTWGLIIPVEFADFHPWISESQESGLWGALLSPSQAFNFSADKSLIQSQAFVFVFSRRFAPGLTPISSIALSLSHGAFDFPISVFKAVFRILLTPLIL